MTGDDAAGGPVEADPVELVVRPLSISPDEIAGFIARTYDSHPHGKSFVPRWTGPFLKHLIFDHPDFTPDHALGAYLGEELVGLVLAQPYWVHLGAEKVKAVFGSWMVITKRGASHFGAFRLIGALKERLKAHGVDLMVGVAYRSGPGVGLDFWESFTRSFPSEVSKGQDLTYWARVLDGRALAAAARDPLLKAGGYASYMRPVMKPRPDPQVRPFEVSDLEQCQQLLANGSATMRTAPTLWELQSAPDLNIGPQTLVLDRGAGPVAMSMFHLLPMSDAGPLGVGMIDHLVAPDGKKDINQLLGPTMWQLKQAGACLALLPKKPDIAGATMIMAGFVPYSAEFKTFMLPIADHIAAEMPASYDLLVR